MTMRKRVDYADWESPRESRPEGGTVTTSVKAKPFDPDESAEFEIEIRVKAIPKTIAVTLFAKLYGKPQRAICRYDVQSNIHHNGTPRGKKFCGRDSIPFRLPHRHIYNAKAVAALGVEDWDICAEVIGLDICPNFDRMKNLLVQQFLSDLEIVIESQDGMDLFAQV